MILKVVTDVVQILWHGNEVDSPWLYFDPKKTRQPLSPHFNHVNQYKRKNILFYID